MTLLARYLAEYRGLVALALALAAINQIFSLLDPLIFRYVIDEYATRYQEYTTREFFRGVGALLLALAHRQLTLDRLREVMRSTTRITSMVFLILLGASLFSLTFRGLGGDDLVHELLAGLPGGAHGALLFVMATMFLLGFVLDFIEITFVVVPIVGPVLLALGVDPIWLGVLMGINLQTSFLTPPFGFALFYLRGVAPPQVTTAHLYRGVAPFIVLQLLALALVWSFPALATWLPSVLYGAH